MNGACPEPQLVSTWNCLMPETLVTGHEGILIQQVVESQTSQEFQHENLFQNYALTVFAGCIS